MTVHHIESGERRPGMNMTELIVTGSPAGAIVADRTSRMGFVGVPEAVRCCWRLVVFGILLGLILYWKHR